VRLFAKEERGRHPSDRNRKNRGGRDLWRPLKSKRKEGGKELLEVTLRWGGEKNGLISLEPKKGGGGNPDS